MQYSAALLPLAFSLAAAQYGDSSGSSSSASTNTASAAPSTFTTSSGVVTHKVAVGNGGLTFTPDSFTAAVGDAVEFHFYPKTHSVSESTFAEPCAPVNASSFFSGGFKTTGTVNDTVFTVIINNTSPIWLYCGYPSHCQNGMVAVINPPSSTTKTLDLYKKAAAGTTNTTVPAQVQGGVKGAAASSGSGSGSGSGSASGTASPSASSTTKPSDAGALKATMGVVAGLLSLAFAGLIL